MSKTTTTSFFSWRGTFQIGLAVAAFFMVDPYIRKLLSFVQEHCIAELSPCGFGACVVLLAGYLLKREWDYRKIYVPRPVSLWLILLLGIYLYYRHWDGTFWFWPTSCTGKLAWSDLLLLPWGGAVAIALRSRVKKDRFFLVLVLLVLCLVLYFVPQAQGKPSLVWALSSLSMAVGSCLLGYLILQRWGYRLQPTSKEEATKAVELSSQAIDTDDAIVSEDDDWLNFSAMAEGVLKNLEVLDLSKDSLTIGIIAHWGRGKSSFINLLRKQIEKNDGLIIAFNPRGSKSVSAIQEDFFDAFAKELSRHYLGFGLLLARYTKHIGLLNQYEWTRPLGSLLTLLLPGKELEAVNRTLRDLGKRVYVLLDDLDRLSAEEILEVLKLIDRNASFANTVFITAYDKDYVNNVLKKHLDHGLNHSFIDKYISFEYPLPEPNREILKCIMEVLLLSKVHTNDKKLHWKMRRGWDQVADLVLRSLDSVRDLKRYFNLMILRYNEVIDKVESEDYFLLYLICHKDFSVYSVLDSRRILRLDATSRRYVLVPNFEKELRLISQWDGTKNILERLFPYSWEGGGTNKSLRSEFGFGFYFNADVANENTPYADVKSKIISCNRKSNPYEVIDAMVEELGIVRVRKAFLYHVKSPRRINELNNRAETIKLMAYIAIKYDQLESGVSILREELLKLLSIDGYREYKELGLVQDLAGYQKMLEPMLSMGIDKGPLWMSDLLSEFDYGGDAFDRFVYLDDKIAEVLLKCQSSYYRGWTPSDNSIDIALAFLEGRSAVDSIYIDQAYEELFSLIYRYPDGCLWMLIDRSYDRGNIAEMKANLDPQLRFLRKHDVRLDAKRFKLSIIKDRLKRMEEHGFSTSKWLDGMTESARYIFDYVGSAPGGEPVRVIDILLPGDSKLDSIDYIYRAILEQEKKDSQQAMPEG